MSESINHEGIHNQLIELTVNVVTRLQEGYDSIGRDRWDFSDCVPSMFKSGSGRSREGTLALLDHIKVSKKKATAVYVDGCYREFPEYTYIELTERFIQETITEWRELDASLSKSEHREKTEAEARRKAQYEKLKAIYEPTEDNE